MMSLLFHSWTGRLCLHVMVYNNCMKLLSLLGLVKVDQSKT